MPSTWDARLIDKDAGPPRARAGKSTLLSCVAGLAPVRSGSILLDGHDLTRWPTGRRVRAGISLVPEGRHVFAGLTVEENLMLGSYTRRTRDLEPSRTHVFDLFPRLAERIGQRAGTLSGGEQQMLAIGRALLGDPRLLLLDEPSLGLAPRAVAEVMDSLRALLDDGITILLVEQNVHVASTVAQRGYLPDRGEVVAAASTKELVGHPNVPSWYLGASPYNRGR